MKDKFFEIDVQLLVLRYGRQRVLDALARIDEQTREELDRSLRDSQQKPRPRPITAKPTLADIVAIECRDRPNMTEQLRELALKYENRLFLPELRDVKRFLDRIGAPSVGLKSRVAAGPVLIRALAKLPPEELMKLTMRDRTPHESDYSLLSRAIMGRPAAKPRDKG